MRDLHGFLDGQSGASRRFFQGLLRSTRVAALLEERSAVVERWSGPHEPQAEWRAAFDRMQLMGTPEFAREQSGLFGGAGARNTSPPASTRVTDLDSDTSTTSGGRQLTPRVPVALAPGATLEVGSSRGPRE